MLHRRGFIGALLAAPAIIRTPGLLMAVKPARMERIYPEFVYTGSHGGTVGAVLYFRDLTIHSPIEVTLIRENAVLGSSRHHGRNLPFFDGGATGAGLGALLWPPVA